VSSRLSQGCHSSTSCASPAPAVTTYLYWMGVLVCVDVVARCGGHATGGARAGVRAAWVARAGQVGHGAHAGGLARFLCFSLGVRADDGRQWRPRLQRMLGSLPARGATLRRVRTHPAGTSACAVHTSPSVHAILTACLMSQFPRASTAPTSASSWPYSTVALVGVGCTTPVCGRGCMQDVRSGVTAARHTHTHTRTHARAHPSWAAGR
jgi:hypothetical protein